MNAALMTLVEPFNFLVNVNKRIFFLYLITAAIMIVLFYGANSKKIRAIFKLTFSKKYWFNHSSLIDMQWLFFNQLCKWFILLPVFMSQVALTMMVYHFFTDNFAPGDFIALSATIAIILYTGLLFLVDDFSRFFLHMLYHKIPMLWRFHAIHHSAVVLSPLTLYRVHFIEYLLNNLRAILVSGVLGGIYIYTVDARIGTLEIMGVNAITFVFNMLGANLRHSHVHLGFGRLEILFISPAQHQIHHSNAKKHLDKNFGSCLSVWDAVFCSLVFSNERSRVKRFGLYNQESKLSFVRQLTGIPVTPTKNKQPADEC